MKNASQRVLTVKTNAGVLEGFQENNIEKFYGIRYAAPPIDMLRWCEPQPVKPWIGVIKAHTFGPIAPQMIHSRSQASEGDFMESEDCLYLNVWTPSAHGDKKLPVIVWIHGGGFMNGSGAFLSCHGTELAKRGVVTVTFNYRLGPLGNLAHPDLEKESENGMSGNYGFLDQIAALKWIRSNITNFGGNPNNITIMGQSAGAMSVALLCSSPRAKGLFHKAICQSGGFLVPPREIPYKESLEDGLELQKALGVNCIEEMRQIPPKRLLEAAKGLVAGDEQPKKLRFSPALDNIIIKNQNDTLLEKAKIPLIVGSNKDEATFFTAMTPPVTVNYYKSYIRRSFGEKAARVLTDFPADSNEEAKKQFIYLLTYNLFTAPVFEIAKALSELGGDVYVYRFNRLAPKNRESGIGVSHGEEVPYLFGHVTAQGYGDADKKLSEAMMDYWIQFCRTGDPNSKELPEWPKFSSTVNGYLELTDEITARDYIEDKSFTTLFPFFNVSRQSGLL